MRDVVKYKNDEWVLGRGLLARFTIQRRGHETLSLHVDRTLEYPGLLIQHGINTTYKHIYLSELGISQEDMFLIHKGEVTVELHELLSEVQRLAIFAEIGVHIPPIELHATLGVHESIFYYKKR